MKLFNRKKVLLNAIENLNEKDIDSRRAIVRFMFIAEWAAQKIREFKMKEDV